MNPSVDGDNGWISGRIYCAMVGISDGTMGAEEWYVEVELLVYIKRGKMYVTNKRRDSVHGKIWSNMTELSQDSKITPGR